MRVGKYYINQDIESIIDELVEFTDEEYRLINSVFDKELIYHGKYVQLFNQQWKTTIGVFNDKVYKIAVTINDTKLKYSKVDILSSYRKLRNMLDKQYGNPNDEKRTENSLFYNFSEINWQKSKSGILRVRIPVYLTKQKR